MTKFRWAVPSTLCALALAVAGGLAPAPISAAWGQDEEEADAAAKPPERVLSVSGVAASIDEFPWQVALVHDDGRSMFDAQFCGGSAISPTWILTAAHCVDGERAGDLLVYWGSASLAGGGTIVDVKRIVQHTGYDTSTSENDIALLELNEPIAATAIRLSNAETAHLEAAGTLSVVTGWGESNPEGPAGDRVSGVLAAEERPQFPTELQSAALPVVDMATCAAAFPDSGSEFDERIVCAGSIKEGVDACNGDSGGPLQVRDADGRYVQIGIVSWGERCARDGYYTVYTRVSSFTDWITAGMAGGSEPEATAEGEVAVAATFGRIDLSAGFPGDPVSVAVEAGGPEDATRLGGACRGYIATNPDVSLFYEAGGYALYISAASKLDTTLAILSPDGRMSCSDDFDGLNPAVEFGKPVSGEYKIWIGSYEPVGATYPKATLYISEISAQFGR